MLDHPPVIEAIVCLVAGAEEASLSPFLVPFLAAIAAAAAAIKGRLHWLGVRWCSWVWRHEGLFAGWFVTWLVRSYE